MDRRTILTGAAASAAGLALPRGVSHAQQAGKIYRIGVLLNRNNPSPETETLRTGLTQLGYTEGINVIYEVRAAEGQLNRRRRDRPWETLQRSFWSIWTKHNHCEQSIPFRGASAPSLEIIFIGFAMTRGIASLKFSPMPIQQRLDLPGIKERRNLFLPPV